MAKISYEDTSGKVLTFEIIIPESRLLDADFIQYNISLTWDGVPVLNDNAMKRDNPYWAQGTFGKFIIDEYKGALLLETLKEAAETGDAKTYESWPDPDLKMLLYPHATFPYLRKSDKDDFSYKYITMIVMGDLYQFKGCDCYSDGFGAAFILCPTIDEYKDFVSSLENEYAEAIRNHVKKSADEQQ